MRLESGGDGFWPSHLEMLDLLRRAAGDRHLGADDVARRRGGVSRHGLGDNSEAGGALGRHGVRQVVGLALTAHAGVEVDLLVPGGDVGGHHRLSLAQRRFGGQVPPTDWGRGDRHQELCPGVGTRPDQRYVHLVAESDRGQTCVAALVVDLVAGGLDEHRGSIGGGLAYRRLDHHRMRRAHRGDPGRPDAGTAAAEVDEGSRARHAAWFLGARPQGVELGEARGAFHRASDAHCPGTAGVGIIEALLHAAALQPAGDEGGAEQSPAPVGSNSSTG